MKINRLLEILTMLLNHETVTAKELADRFGVSTRTIYRDILQPKHIRENIKARAKEIFEKY